YTPSLLEIMPDVDTDKALLHGIIRQESQFDTNATSPSGALGLAQLMPATAKEIAEQNGLDYNKDWLTERPSYNIRISSAYIDKLLTRFGGSYPLAIAAYNAGPRRVSEWLEEYGDPRIGKVDWIDWLEMIPVAETRNYVQRVTEGVVLYREAAGMKSY
ncbi:MAG: lytic transglycosylase domain-containing protein, partial [Pseudomonadota bacterium]